MSSCTIKVLFGRTLEYILQSVQNLRSVPDDVLTWFSPPGPDMGASVWTILTMSLVTFKTIRSIVPGYPGSQPPVYCPHVKVGG